VKEQEMEIEITRKRKDKYALIDLYNYQHNDNWRNNIINGIINPFNEIDRKMTLDMHKQQKRLRKDQHEERSKRSKERKYLQNTIYNMKKK
jgi:hypothetical protein